MSDKQNPNTGSEHQAQRARLAYSAVVVALRELGSDPEFSPQTSQLLDVCGQLAKAERNGDR